MSRFCSIVVKEKIMNEKKIAQKSIDQKSIAFFDSGVGGLTVFEKVKKLLPNENYIYFGDTKNVPYGSKTNEELLKYTTEIFKFFELQDVKVVVMACNTTSATIYDDLRKLFGFKIYPIIQSCASVIAKMPIKRIGVLATEATIKSGAYGKELKKYNKDLEVFEMSCPPWVGIVEENRQNEPKSVASVNQHLGKILEHHPEKIILGCTHYPYLMNILDKIVAKDTFIDPAQYFAEFIKADLAKNNMLNDSKVEGTEKFYVSANPENFKQASAMFYQIKELPNLAKL